MLRYTICLLPLMLTACFRLGFDPPREAGPAAEAGLSQEAGADLAGDGGVDADDSGDARIDISGPDAGPPAIVVSGLAASWTTPNVIRWTWQAGGDATRFSRFTLITGTSKSEVLAGSGGAATWTAAQNPELGHFTLPNSGNDPVVATSTFKHKPATTYYAQLHALDDAQRRSSTQVVSAATAPQTTKAVVVFSEAQTAGYSIPSGFKHSSAHPYQGTYHYAYTAACNGGKASCWENLRRQGTKVDLGGITAAALKSSAIYEFAAACSGAHAYWADLSLRFGGSGDKLWFHSGWTLRCDGAYRRHQVPLSAFTNGGVSLPHSELTKLLFEFNTVGGQWTAASWVHVDEIRVRW